MTRVKQQQDKKAENSPFDLALVGQRRARAQKLAHKLSGDRFLHTRCVDDAAERLLDVKRQFQNTLLIGAPDITQNIIERLGDKIGRTTIVNDVVGDVEALPFKPESFDLIINLLTLHAVNEVPQVLAKTRSLLKPDGLFLAAFFGGETLSVSCPDAPPGMRMCKLFSPKVSPSLRPVPSKHQCWASTTR